MDVSKASSGYGSVSGSDEEEKEEGVVTALQGKPSGRSKIVCSEVYAFSLVARI
jgi:hypothetical protein